MCFIKISVFLFTIYRKCIDYITYCNTCLSKDECTSCIEQYGLYHDKTKCVNSSDSHYYKKAEDTLFYSCKDSLYYCNECLSESVCIKCISQDYIINNNKCFLTL